MSDVLFKIFSIILLSLSGLAVHADSHNDAQNKVLPGSIETNSTHHLAQKVVAQTADSAEGDTASDHNDVVDVWLDKMGQAMHQQNFQGTLIIRQQDELQAIKVKQGVTAQGSWQTLESLTGEAQTILRNNDKVTTFFPAKKLLTVSDKVDNSPLHSELPDNRQALKQYYHLQLSGVDRIANKDTQMIQMIPLDQHRYGYAFWLDQQTGLLLKYDLIDEKGQVLEQLMYSNIELLDKAPDNQIDMAELDTFRKIDLANEIDVLNKNWQIKELPAGFALTRSVMAQQPNQQAPIYHMVYSDGMASVSVFIEQRKQTDKPVIGLSSIGAVNVYSSFINNAYITAIGEVPASTVQMIAESLQPIE